MVYKWYILPIGGLYTTYHLLREPEESIETTVNLRSSVTSLKLKDLGEEARRRFGRMTFKKPPTKKLLAWHTEMVHARAPLSVF